MKNPLQRALAALCLATGLALLQALQPLSAQPLATQPQTAPSLSVHPLAASAPIIENDTFWNTADGQPLYSQGGGIFRFPDPATGQKKYYWYGVHYAEAETYRNDPSTTQQGNRFKAVTCYSSTDLVTWKFEANALTDQEILTHQGNQRMTWMGRMGVAFVAEAKKYVMVIQYGSQVLFTVSGSPTGPFTWHHVKNMKSWIGTTNTGDQTVFTDEDTGKSYLVYSYGQGRNKIYLSEIGLQNDTLTLLNYKEVFRGAGREGNCMFKYKGKFYLAASDLYGWDGSHAYYLVADDIWGPYTPENNMLVLPGCEDDYAHISQTGFFYTVRGTQQETVIFCGDRWADFAGNGLGYNQWCPLSFEGYNPTFNSLQAWQLDATTGLWQVAPHNNWVKNASFEADRKQMPSAVKPVQTRLLGWETTILKGTPVSLDSLSPVLNHANTREERRQVIGERSLRISDRVPFTRKVHQRIASTPTVPFPDGTYTLTAKIKNNGPFTRLEMYATSGTRTTQATVTTDNPQYTTLRLDAIQVTGNQVEIGFLAEGPANADCFIDDVSLVRADSKK